MEQTQSESQAITTSLNIALGDIEPGQVWVIAARPGMGKTIMALTLCDEVIKLGNPAEFITSEYTKKQIENWIPQNTAGLRVLNGEEIANYADVLKSIETSTAKIVFIDNADSYFYENYDALHEIKKMAIRKNVGIVLTAQLPRSVEQSGDMLPASKHLRDEYVQIADKVILLWRPAHYAAQGNERFGKVTFKDVPNAEYAEAIIVKNKQGDLTTIPLRINLQQKYFTAIQ